MVDGGVILSGKARARWLSCEDADLYTGPAQCILKTGAVENLQKPGGFDLLLKIELYERKH
jgi:hypothetical protein